MTRPASAPLRLHAWIEGRVQGVGFRYFVADAANREQAVGWVRNLRDGRVEVVAEGPEESLNALLADLRRGPPGSRVAGVEARWGEASGAFTQFSLERTA